MDDVHICPRRPYDCHAEERQNCLHVYGVDFWTAKDVKALFDPMGAQTIEWLDDSSMNVVFSTNETGAKAMQTLCPAWTEGANPSSWFSLAPQHTKNKAAVEVRRCTTSDRKDSNHDGSKSLFYEHMREQNALRQQRTRTRRTKKKARLQRHEEKRRSVPETGIVKDDSSSSSDDATSRPVLESGGFFNPLLFMKANQKPAVPSLAAVLERAEANPTASCSSTAPATAAPATGTTAATTADRKRRRPEKARKNSTASDKGKGKGGKDKAQPKILQCVHNFFQEHSVKHRRHHVNRSFRSLIFANQKKKETPASVSTADKTGSSRSSIVSMQEDDRPEQVPESAILAIPEEPKPAATQGSPWDEYLTVNQLGHLQLVHSILYSYGEGDRERVAVIIPHPLRTNEEVLAKALKHPENLHMCKLKEVAKYSQCPLFVCAPFGLQCMLLVDSRIVESKRPLLFDLGTSAVSLEYSEFLRSCKASCVEGLAKEVV